MSLQTEARTTARLRRIIKRDLQATPRPAYPQLTIDDLAPSVRALYDLASPDTQELIRATCEVLSDIAPRDRRFILARIREAADYYRSRRNLPA